MKTMTKLFLTGALLFPLGLIAGDKSEAQEKTPKVKMISVSPDKKFGVRVTYRGENPQPGSNIEGAELVELATKKVVLDLAEDASETQTWAGEVVWSEDSQRFAFGLQGKRVSGVEVYEKRGNKFEALKLPDLKKFTPAGKENEEVVKYINGGEEPVRWLTPRTLKIKRTFCDLRNVKDTDQSLTLNGEYELVIAFDEKGTGTVKKVLKRKEYRADFK